jgi:F0F1-type ATP synthase assembly protein I
MSGRARRGQRMTIVNAMLALVVMIVVLQLWLLTATMNAYLGGDSATVVPAAVASLACLGLNAGLLVYLARLD